MAVATQHPDLIINADILRINAELGDYSDIAALQGLSLDHQAAWDAIAAGGHPLDAATSAGPTVIQATRVVWGDMASNGIELTGTGLDQVADLAALEAALENGIASGAFEMLRIVADGVQIGTIGLNPASLTLTTGNQLLMISGALPTGLQEIYNLLPTLGVIAAFNIYDPALQDAIRDWQAYDIDSLSLRDSGAELLNLTLGETQLSLMVGGALLTIDGTFPTSSFGAVLDLLAQADFLDAMGLLTRVSDLDGVTVSGARLVSDTGQTLIEIDGPLDDLYFDTVHVIGSDGADVDIEYPLFTTADTGRILVETGAGYDSVIVYGDELLNDDIAPLTVDLGGAGRIVLIDYQSNFIGIDFADGTIGGEGYGWDGPSTYSFDFIGDSVELNAWGLTRAFGSMAGDTVIQRDPGSALMFDGGDGSDTWDLSEVAFGSGPFGISRAEFLANTGIFHYGDSDLEFTYGDARGTLGGPVMGQLLRNVETVLLRGEGGGTELASLSGLVRGIDADILLGTSDDDALAGAAGQGALLLGQNGDDLLLGDGQRAGYNGEAAASTYRLYQATLGRSPDRAGHEDWTGRLASGELTLAQATSGFVGSPEFQRIYGELDNTAFVELLYQNVLGRSADATGLADWTGRLDSGTSTRESVVNGFSESAEFINATRGAANSFIRDSDPANWADEVFRVYQATLARDPDAGGFANWTGRLAEGRTLASVIEGFTGSAEFQNTYGALDNAGFVDLLYRNVLNRAADAGGLADWTGRLDSGTSRAEVVRGFSESAEFVTNTAAPLRAWMLAQGTDDEIVGGAGDDTMAGGALSDHFAFSAFDAGADRVLDLEAWDTLEFQDFGYGSAADALARMGQTGADVVFADGDVTVTFVNTQLAQITEDMIWV